MENDGPIRLQVYLARCGVGSRRTCETYIAEGLVSVDGEIVTRAGTKVDGSEHITYRGRTVRPERTTRYLALNKPRGYLCANSDPYDRPLATELFGPDITERLFHVGRLDFESEGLIFFTNDGEFARIVSHPSSEIEKEYTVETKRPIEKQDLDTFVEGVKYEGVRYKIDSYSVEGRRRVRLVLHEGKNRELRQLFRSAGYTVARLRRTRIGNVRLGSLPPGAYRALTKPEIESLKVSAR